METILFRVAVFTEKRLRKIVDSNKMAAAIVVDDDDLKNSFAGAVEQRPPSGENIARRSKARIVQEMAIELRDEEVVEVVIRCSAVDQEMDEVAAVTGVAVGDGRS